MDNKKIRKALFVSLRPIVMRYLEEYSGSGCVVLVQW